VLRELLTADVERVESVGAVSTVLEQVLFGLRLLLHRLVLAEAEASAFDTGRLDGEDKIIIVLTVEERHEALLASEALVDEEVLLIVAHRVSEIDVIDLPPVALKLENDGIILSGIRIVLLFAKVARFYLL
jgi:hypothetical protein